jgi:hypothetical protein
LLFDQKWPNFQFRLNGFLIKYYIAILNPRDLKRIKFCFVLYPTWPLNLTPYPRIWRDVISSGLVCSPGNFRFIPDAPRLLFHRTHFFNKKITNFRFYFVLGNHRCVCLYNHIFVAFISSWWPWPRRARKNLVLVKIYGPGLEFGNFDPGAVTHSGVPKNLICYF